MCGIPGQVQKMQTPALIEYFQIPLCKSGPDAQLINICGVMSLGCVYN